MITISGLYVYPIKSCAGVSLQQARIGRYGIEGDRGLLVIDQDNRFLTQRELHKLALVVPALTGNAVVLAAPGMPELRVPIRQEGAPLEVVIWRDTVSAVGQGAEADDWLSQFLGKPVRLVGPSPEYRRVCDQAFAPRASDETLFADGFPELLASEASLADLNARLATPVPMNRFRPNIVVSGTAAYDEDRWKKIQAGEITFEVVKPCARCVLTTVDQATGEAGKEPLKTLAGYRTVGGKVLFTQNLVHANTGMVAVGDAVEILAAGA